jgi:DNA-binding NarL/FixJ family response regulator
MKQIRVLIADDHELIRNGVRQLLEKEPDFIVCGEASNGREAVDLSEQLKPDVVVLDITMPELNGLDALPRIKRVAPETEILIFSSQESERLVHQLLKSGARGYLLKTGVSRHLVSAVRALAAHKPFFSSKISQIVFESYLNGGVPTDDQLSGDPLTAREREIVQLLAEGRNNKDVAANLGISVKTAETHRANIMRKLELDSFSELVRYAIRNNIIEA